MKIKTKKQFTLPQLIEWGFDNPELVEGKIYNIDDQETPFDPYVVFPENRMGVRVPYVIEHDDTFTVTVEEEITEDTVIPRLVTRNTSGGYNEWSNDCVNGFNLEYIEAIHILNDDLSLTLIWRDGRLIE